MPSVQTLREHALRSGSAKLLHQQHENQSDPPDEAEASRQAPVAPGMLFKFDYTGGPVSARTFSSKDMPPASASEMKTMDGSDILSPQRQAFVNQVANICVCCRDWDLPGLGKDGLLVWIIHHTARPRLDFRSEASHGDVTLLACRIFWLNATKWLCLGTWAANFLWRGFHHVRC